MRTSTRFLGEEGRRFFQEVTLFRQTLVLAPQTVQFFIVRLHDAVAGECCDAVVVELTTPAVQLVGADSKSNCGLCHRSRTVATQTNRFDLVLTRMFLSFGWHWIPPSPTSTGLSECPSNRGKSI